jgi:membrane protein required for beta-lactamase induction
MKLLALILAFAISHFIPKPQKFRNFHWLKSWSDWYQSKSTLKQQDLNLLVIIALPVVLISVILFSIISSLVGQLLVSILVLVYCIGPESLDEDVESNQIRSKLNIGKNASIATLIKKMVRVSLGRWFGIFFWYVILGIEGVLIYRFAERLLYFIPQDSNLKPSINKLMKILNYPVAWFMVISLAIASDFERIFKKCKPYMNVQNIKKMDASFLYEAADFAVENCEVEPESGKSLERVTLSVLKRMLVVWLVFVAILVIFTV